MKNTFPLERIFYSRKKVWKSKPFSDCQIIGNLSFQCTYKKHIMYIPTYLTIVQMTQNMHCDSISAAILNRGKLGKEFTKMEQKNEKWYCISYHLYFILTASLLHSVWFKCFSPQNCKILRFTCFIKFWESCGSRQMIDNSLIVWFLSETFFNF